MEIKISVIEGKNNVLIQCDDNNTIMDVLNLLVRKNIIDSVGESIYSHRLRIKLVATESFRSNLIQTGDIIYVD